MVAKGAVSFQSPYALKRYNDSEYACGRPQAWCDYETTRMNDFASAKLKLCDKMGEKAVWPSGRTKVHLVPRDVLSHNITSGHAPPFSRVVRAQLAECMDDVRRIEDAIAVHVGNCSNQSAACNARGNCTGASKNFTGPYNFSAVDNRGNLIWKRETLVIENYVASNTTSDNGNFTDGTCVCDGTWEGPQCTVRRACRFWDTRLNTWSSNGCRKLGVVENWTTMQGSMLCECDHLTDFALAAEVMSDPAALFSALGQLEINVPIPLSLAEFITAITKMSAGNWATMGGMAVVMYIGLKYAAFCDRKFAVRSFDLYSLLPPQTRKCLFNSF
jgi:hypothetical protein